MVVLTLRREEAGAMACHNGFEDGGESPHITRSVMTTINATLS